MKNFVSTVPIEVIENKIYIIRDTKVMFDFDLAFLYQVTTGNLNLAVRRNKSRFPADFMFQLTNKEYDSLLLQIARAKTRGGRRSNPYAFTEQGVAMLSAVLKSKRAVGTSILIVRAFIKLRKILQSHKDILLEIEKIKKDQKKQGEKISAIISVINKFFTPVSKSKREKIGFSVK